MGKRTRTNAVVARGMLFRIMLHRDYLGSQRFLGGMNSFVRLRLALPVVAAFVATPGCWSSRRFGCRSRRYRWPKPVDVCRCPPPWAKTEVRRGRPRPAPAMIGILDIAVSPLNAASPTKTQLFRERRFPLIRTGFRFTVAPPFQLLAGRGGLVRGRQRGTSLCCARPEPLAVTASQHQKHFDAARNSPWL